MDRDRLGLRRQVAAGADVGIRSDDAAVIGAALCSLDGWAATMHLFPRNVEPPTAGAGVTMLTLANEVSSPARSSSSLPSIDTEWVVYTSGTTGEPKPIRHTLASLSRTISGSPHGSDYVWGLLYDPNRMAGLQVILQAIRSRTALIAPSLDTPLLERIDHLVASGVTALSATPTLWRQILQAPTARSWPLRQITLGGEIADEQVLKALRHGFPDARIVHVFASTETGAAFSVRDGLAGFPVEYLQHSPRGVALQIREGILYVHSPGVSAAGADGFASTGDRVEIVGDRVRFLGRETGVVNVGGSNVWPEEVETLLRTHPDVVEASVSARPNALAGNLLVASVVLTDDSDRSGAGKRLRAWVREQAPASHVPATVRVVEQLDVSPAGKVRR